MNMFASFQPSLWKDEAGIVTTAKVDAPKPVVEVRRKPWLALISVPLIALGASNASPVFRFPETAGIVAMAGSPTRGAPPAGVRHGDVAPTYWPKLIRYMKTLPRVEEAEGPDPEPGW